MVVMKRYLRQTGTWLRVTGMNEYAEPVLAGQPIRLRFENKRRVVLDEGGQEVVSEARAFCLENVRPGDYLEIGGQRWRVIAVSESPGLDGRAVYREVAL